MLVGGNSRQRSSGSAERRSLENCSEIEVAANSKSENLFASRLVPVPWGSEDWVWKSRRLV